MRVTDGSSCLVMDNFRKIMHSVVPYMSGYNRPYLTIDDLAEIEGCGPKEHTIMKSLFWAYELMCILSLYGVMNECRQDNESGPMVQWIRMNPDFERVFEFVCHKSLVLKTCLDMANWEIVWY